MELHLVNERLPCLWNTFVSLPGDAVDAAVLDCFRSENTR